MTGNQANGRCDLIENAMNHSNSSANPEGDRPIDPSAMWREEQARALKARQDQLEAARSEEVGTAAARPVVPVQLESASPSVSGRALTLWVLVLMVLGAAGWWSWGKFNGPVAPTPVPAHTGVVQPLPAEQQTVVAPVVEAPAPQPVEDREALARGLVERWRAAWAQRDADAYLASYGPTFVPPKGQTRAQWDAARRDNLSSRTSIKVVVHELRTEPVGDQQMAAYFLQDYISPTYQEKAERKTLLLDRVDGQWRIAGEWSGAFRPVADLKN